MCLKKQTFCEILYVGSSHVYYRMYLYKPYLYVRTKMLYTYFYTNFYSHLSNVMLRIFNQYLVFFFLCEFFTSRIFYYLSLEVDNTFLYQINSIEIFTRSLFFKYIFKTFKQSIKLHLLFS